MNIPIVEECKRVIINHPLIKKKTTTDKVLIHRYLQYGLYQHNTVQIKL